VICPGAAPGKDLLSLKFDLDEFFGFRFFRDPLPLVDRIFGSAHQQRVATYDLGGFHRTVGLDSYEQFDRTFQVHSAGQVRADGNSSSYDLAGAPGLLLLGTRG